MPPVTFETCSPTLPPDPFRSQDSGLSDVPMSPLTLSVMQRSSEFYSQVCSLHCLHLLCCSWCGSAGASPSWVSISGWTIQHAPPHCKCLFDPSAPISLNLFMPSPSPEIRSCYETQAGLRAVVLLPFFSFPYTQLSSD